ncbi:hypothetical protein ACROYT_G033961 [Oculina patagonica]
MKWPKNKVKTLGLWISTNPELSVSLNYSEKLEKVKEMLGCWKYRRLTLLGPRTCPPTTVRPKGTPTGPPDTTTSPPDTMTALGVPCNSPCFLVTARTEIKAVDYNNGTSYPIISNLTRPFAIDIHFSLGYIFWSDGIERNIKRANIDGTNITTVHNNTGNCGALAVEWISMQLYWTDQINNMISASHLEGNNRRILVSSNLDQPEGIALDPNQGAAKAFQLKPIVDFPTRGENTLDQLFTNIPEYYSRPSSLPAFGLSDHLTVIMKAGIRDKSSKPKRKVIKTRDKRPSKVAEVGRFLHQVPWSGLFSQDQSSEDKLRILTEVINFGLNTIMPERSVTVHETDRPWLTSQLKALIARRQKAFASGNELLYKMLRNKVNRERKRCRRVYYENKVKDLRDSKPRNWWREIKQLCGTTSNTGRDLKSVLHSDLCCEETTLAESINEAFTSVTKDYSPLTNCVRVPTDGDQPISVTEQSVVKKLRAVKTSRAGGPDDLPNWVLREFADILAAPIADILNTSFSECKVPRVWKIANVSPLPKAPIITT